MKHGLTKLGRRPRIKKRKEKGIIARYVENDEYLKQGENIELEKNENLRLSWWSSGKDSARPLQEAQVQSLVREHASWYDRKKKKKKEHLKVSVAYWLDKRIKEEKGEN